MGRRGEGVVFDAQGVVSTLKHMLEVLHVRRRDAGDSIEGEILGDVLAIEQESRARSRVRVQGRR